MNDIPERAAWLDHEIEWIVTPSRFELDRLGLAQADVVLTDKQVDVARDRGSGEAIITVRHIEIVSKDEVNRHLSYRIQGETRLSQLWEPGGANLSPNYNEVAQY